MSRLARTLMLSAFALSVLLPLLWILMSSVKPGDMILNNPWGIPTELKLSNYASAWGEAGIGRTFLNSAFVTIATLAILLPLAAMAAFVLAWYPFRGSKLIFGTFMGGMAFPHFLVIVPLFFLVKDLGLYNQLHGLVIVYVAYSLSFSVFVLHGFFLAIPKELGEAAEIDGCSHSKVFWKVVLPLIKPGLIVTAIFNAIGLWNEYGLALVLITDDSKKTLPVGLANLIVNKNYQADWGALFAGLVIVIAPLLVIYLIFRDKVHETMLAGSIKG